MIMRGASLAPWPRTSFFLKVREMRKLFGLSLLAVLVMMGCSDATSDGPEATACNNDGVLNAGEACDGDQFATGTRACPAGESFIPGKTALDLKCNASCQVVTVGVCQKVEIPVTCGNGKLDDGEACDGEHFVAGKRVCPVGEVLASGKTISDITCSPSCGVVTSGACEKPVTPASCGNGRLDVGEECEGNSFAAGKRTCPVDQVFVTGKTEADITCDASCRVVTSGVCEIAPASEQCGNGVVDADELCDGTAFYGNDSTCAGYSAMYKSGTLKCTESCHVDESGCVVKCGDGVVDADEECDGTSFATGKRACPSGTGLVSGKTEADITCDASCRLVTAGVCEALPEVASCDGDVYKLCQGDDCETQDCSKTNQTCDDSDPEHVGCVDLPIVQVCDGNVYRICQGSECTDEDCAAKGLVCDDSDPANVGCVGGACTVNDATVCEGDILKLCVVEGDGHGEWLTENCADSFKTCGLGADGNADCISCGNGYVDTGEQCDPKGPAFPVYPQVTCHYYDAQNGDTVFVSGAPSCTNACKVSIESCVKAQESDWTSIKKWTFSGLQQIIDLTKAGGDAEMIGVFGANYSTYNNGWSLGNWSANAFGKEVRFKLGNVKQNSVRVDFTTRRANGDSSPKTLKLRFYDGDKVLYTSPEIALSGTSIENQSVTYAGQSAIADLKIGFSAYGADAGHVVFNNIEVKTVNGI